MADMPTDFWGGWIALLTVTSLAGLGWAVFSVYFSGNGEDAESAVWDETLREGANPAPMWWFWLILALTTVSVIYLMLYPGLGSFSGVLRWSQGGRLQQSLGVYEEEFGGLRTEILAAPLQALQADPMVMASARRVYDQNCAACHGPEARGQANLFPDLTDAAWQWGGAAERLEQTLRMGRQAVMPPLSAVLGDEGVARSVAYVRTLSRGDAAPEDDPDRALFATYCAACHGADGTGNELLGAPNLTDDVWLYGDTEESLTHTIANGRSGIMPAFEARLDDAQIRMLVAWLSRGGD